jgi:hypothetical protein
MGHALPFTFFRAMPMWSHEMEPADEKKMGSGKNGA